MAATSPPKPSPPPPEQILWRRIAQILLTLARSNLTPQAEVQLCADLRATYNLLTDMELAVQDVVDAAEKLQEYDRQQRELYDRLAEERARRASRPV
jgi:hypothetical protein